MHQHRTAADAETPGNLGVGKLAEECQLAICPHSLVLVKRIDAKLVTLALDGLTGAHEFLRNHSVESGAKQLDL